MKKIKPNSGGFVYSTDPNFRFEQDHGSNESLQPAQQKLRIILVTKHRAGKAVTLIQGFVGKNEELEDLGKKLKNFCGTGGAVKDGEIIVQGDQREKVMQWLEKNGFKNAKRV